jgi:hypothetical protein
MRCLLWNFRRILLQRYLRSRYFGGEPRIQCPNRSWNTRDYVVRPGIRFWSFDMGASF